MTDVRFVLVGLGNLGRRLCEIVAQKRAQLAEKYGLNLILVGAADSRGAAYDPAGLDLDALVRAKLAGQPVSSLAACGKPDWDAITLVNEAEADLLLEASLVNLSQGAEPGLTCVRRALQKGWHVVTPNKGPMVVAYQELHDLAREKGVKLRFDGTVAGGLPAINLGARDLRGAEIERIEAVPNLVTGYVMDMLAEGLSWDAALKRAHDEGVLEADAAWDLEGWDAAAKLVILCNAVLGYAATMDDVARTGITALKEADLAAARAQGLGYRLLARAEARADGGYDLSVAPVALPAEHPLGRLGRKQMGVVYTSDIFGSITAIIDEVNPVPSAATMLRDLLDIYLSD